jgi:hypothetical protein
MARTKWRIPSHREAVAHFDEEFGPGEGQGGQERDVDITGGLMDLPEPRGPGLVARPAESGHHAQESREARAKQQNGQDRFDQIVGHGAPRSSSQSRW